MSIGSGPGGGPPLRRVFVRGLTLQALLGVHPHEKAAPQRIVIGVEMAVEDDAAAAGVGRDELGRVVDYERVVEAARAEAGRRHTMLVETLAERIAMAALADPRVLRVRVTVEKPDAFHDVASVGVAVERSRGGARLPAGARGPAGTFPSEGGAVGRAATVSPPSPPPRAPTAPSAPPRRA
ncbi:dihydroneopterin aldolase [Roseomonas acroporae]|uniref:dihydroneopterin aldolase n=1 Tax=Roseomonas acroporae TaxID=2937791 RepID=UPI0031F4CE05